MKREKNYKTARLIEALEYIDVRFIEEAAEKIKPRPTGQAFYGKPSRSKALRQFLALAACVLLLSAAIPAITYLANHLPDIVAFFIGDETTGTDPELTHPETPAPETTVPSPETTEETTEIYHETTEEPWPSTTAPREETTSPEETTAEETASPPEPEYDGSRGLKYHVIGDFAQLDSIGTCTDTDIVVASYYYGYPVKWIGESAFSGLTQIKSIRLSDTVERIQSNAFRDCTSLESIYIGSGFKDFNSNAFWGCVNISKIEVDPDNNFYEGKNCIINKSQKALVLGCRTTVIPADGSVTRIDGLAFIDVHGLTSITIPEGITSLGEDAFSGCPDLKSIHFSSTVNSFELVSVMGCDALEVITVDPKNPRFYSSGNCVIEKETGTLFLGCAGSVIPNDGSIKKIGYYAFGGNGSLVSVTVPEGVTYIDGYAFASCESLKSVYLPDSLITLGYGVFYHSSALESVRIGKNLETIGSSVFDECSKLNNLSFPKTLKRIGEMVFMECKSLASVSFEGTGAEWKAIEKVELWNAGAAFSTVHCSDGDLELYEYDGSRGLLYVQYGSYAQLAGIGTCTDKNIVIASAYNGVPVVIIEDGVFKSNKNIRSLTIPDKVHYIGKQAFAFCTSLESVVLPENLKTLGADAFNGCVALTEFTFKGTKAEWNAIEKQDGWNDGCPFTVVHCSDGDVLAEPITYDEATELARQYWSPIESGYFVCYASYEMYLLVRPDEVIVDRIYIDRYTGEISMPKLTYPDIPDPLLKVLLNETTYIRQFDYGSEGYFKDTVLDYPTAETGSFGYAVCDLDGDGKEELILSSMQYEIVLREFEGKVYGYLFNFRSLLDLKTDGSFNFTSNAGMTYGTARLSFDGTKYVFTELTRRETADDGSISYFVDDKKVTKAEFDAREALLSQEEAPYEHLAIYPLRAWFPGG